MDRSRRCNVRVHFARELHRHIAFGVCLPRDRVVEHVIGGHVSLALNDMHVAGQVQVVGQVVEHAVVGINRRVGLHVVHVARGSIDFAEAIDMHLIGSQSRRAA